MIEIRPMKVKDFNQILKIERESFSSPWTIKAFNKELNNNYGYYLVAVKEEQVVGYIGVWFVLDEAHITTLAIKINYRRQGIAIKLLKRIIKDSREDNINKITLEVRRSNKVAQKLYKKIGFVSIGFVEEYYTDNQEDALLMWKKV